jgi:hypothetical protein
VARQARLVQLKLWRKPMRDAARALDDVSDHLGEVLRRADELLVEWSRLGLQVRAQVEREVSAIGEVVDGAVARAAGAGLDRAIADRLRVLTSELERLEQRTRAASRAVAEHREGDRRVLWIVVAGVVLANALLVALLLRKPEVAPVAEPIRIEAPAASTAPPVDPTQPPTSPSATGSGGAIGPASGSGAAAGAQDGSPAPNAGASPASPASNTGTAGPPSAASAGAAPASPSPNDAVTGAAAKSGAAAPSNAAAKSRAGGSPGTATKMGGGGAPNAAAKQSASSPPSSAGAVRPVSEPPRLTPSPIVLPPKSGAAHGHKKQP